MTHHYTKKMKREREREREREWHLGCEGRDLRKHLGAESKVVELGLAVLALH